MSNFTRSLEALALVAALSAGCKTRLPDACHDYTPPVVQRGIPVWPSFGGGALGRHSGTKAGPIAPRLLWSHQETDGRSHTVGPWPPVVAPDGTVYVGSFDNGGGSTPFAGTLSALDGSSGKRAWAAALDAPLRSSPAVGLDGTVYVHAEDGQVHAFDGRTGAPRWATPISTVEYGGLDSSPAIGADGTVYVATSGDPPAIVALNPLTGCLLWSFPIGKWTISSPAVDASGAVYCGSPDGNVYAVDRTGHEKWRVRSDGPVYSSPAIGRDGSVYVVVDEIDGGTGLTHYACLALDSMTGQRKWSFSMPRLIEDAVGEVSPAIAADGSVILLDSNVTGDRGPPLGASVYSLDGATGTMRWSTSMPAPTSVAAGEVPAIDPDGTIYLTTWGSDWPYTDEAPQLIALDGDSGARKWAMPLEASYGGGSPSLGADGTIYIGMGQGQVFAVGQ